MHMLFNRIHLLSGVSKLAITSTANIRWFPLKLVLSNYKKPDELLQ